MKNNVSKIMALLLCLVMLLSIFLTSCDSGSSTPSDTSSSQTESTVVGNSSTNTESSGSSSNSEAASSNAGGSNVATEPSYHITKDNEISLKMTDIASIQSYTDSNGVSVIQGNVDVFSVCKRALYYLAVNTI